MYIVHTTSQNYKVFVFYIIIKLTYDKKNFDITKLVIDNSNKNATQTSSLKTENTRKTVRGLPPPTQATHYLYLFFYYY